jgi:ribosomal protein S18 acetylase RimI-like enzyme
MEVFIREFQAKDLDDLVLLMAQLGYKHTKNSLQNNLDLMQKHGGQVFVAEYDSNVCGCIAVNLNIGLAEDSRGEIISLVVSEQARGLGIGKKLVAQGEKWITSHTNRLRVRANTIRTQAHKFYKSLGYRVKKSQFVLEKDV